MTRKLTTEDNRTQRRYVIMSNCPECGAQTDVSTGTKAGEIVYCPGCNAELEVVTVDPVALALAPGIEEDWGE